MSKDYCPNEFRTACLLGFFVGGGGDGEGEEKRERSASNHRKILADIVHTHAD